MRETVVDRLIISDLKDLESQGKCSWHKNEGNMYQTSGRADFTACVEGHYVDIEAKAGNGHPVKLNQLFEGYKTCKANGIFIVAFPDYTKMEELPIEELNWNLSVNKANELRDEELEMVAAFRNKINREKRSVMYVRKKRNR